MKKCYQTKNVYGYPIQECGADVASGIHHIPQHIIAIHCVTPEEQMSCSHHEPIYDDFKAWAQRIRNEKMPKL